MSDIKRYIPLKTIVGYAIDECDKTIADFDKFWLFGFRALADLYLQISAEPKSVRLPVNPNQTVTLPADYITWTKIGVMGSDGKVSTLRINNSLSTFRDNNPNRLSALTPDVNNSLFNNLIGLPYFINFYGNGAFTPLFGLRSGLIQYGECKVDEKNGVIILSPTYSFADIVLEYLSSPEEDGEYQVEIFLQEAIISFCKWKSKMGSELDYYNRKREARRKLFPATLQMVNQIIRENAGYKIKA